MEPLKFCTEPFPPRDQKEVWSEWFQPDFDVYPEETDEPAFKAQYVIWRLGDVSLTWTSAPATRSVRAPSHLRQSPIDHWVITYCRDGATRLSTKDGQLDAHAGVPFVWSLGHVSDSRRTAAQRLQLYLPRDSFSRIGPCLDNAASSALDTPMGHLLAEYMCLLQRNAKGLAYEDAVRLRDAVEAMVAACFLPSAERLAAASPQIELTRMERVRRAVRRNLRSPSLGPDKLCREAAMSRSKLYRLLEGEGGVANYIRRCRLTESFAILCDASNETVIGRIAESLCFADASSFSRAFRRQFGISPSDVRGAAMAGFRPVAQPSRVAEMGARSFSDCLRA